MTWKKALQILSCAVALAIGALATEQASHTRLLSRAHASGALPEASPLAIDTIETTEETDESVDMVFTTDEVRTSRAVGEALQNGEVITGSTANRLILFTFDDGPDRRSTPRLLRYLDEADLKAVFFVTTNKVEGMGARIRAQAEILRDIVRRGHLVGNHTHEHTPLPLADTPTVITEIETAQDAIEGIIGVRPFLFRPPGGTRSPRVDRLIAERGYTQVLWNIGTGDFQVRTADEVVGIWTRILERREREHGERGGIILMHDTHPWTVEAFPRIVAELRQRNCDLLETGEELYDIVDDPALFFRERGDDVSAETPLLHLPEDVLARRQARVREQTIQRCNP